jgi:tRNA pseudouridine55 synthase
MIIVTGKECRNAMNYSKLDKEYEATIRLGHTSTTGDPEGELTTISGDQPQLSDVQAALEQFQGEITQRPPMFSAIKINGRRAYDLARKGEVVEMPERKVTIYSLHLLDYTYPDIRIRVHVSSGTYIRTLAEDIGKVLRTGAYCAELRRTKVGEWSVDGARSVALTND